MIFNVKITLHAVFSNEYISNHFTLQELYWFVCISNNWGQLESLRGNFLCAHQAKFSQKFRLKNWWKINKRTKINNYAMLDNLGPYFHQAAITNSIAFHRQNLGYIAVETRHRARVTLKKQALPTPHAPHHSAWLSCNLQKENSL